MTRTQRHALSFKIWIKLRGVLAILIVLVGICIGLVRVLLPYESLYHEALEKFLEKQWDMQVQIEGLEGEWRGSGPDFKFQRLTLSGEQQAVIRDARLHVNLFQLAMPGGAMGVDLNVEQFNMTYHRQGTTQFTLTTDSGDESFSEVMDALLDAGDFSIDQLNIRMAGEQNAALADINARFLLEKNPSQKALLLQLNPSELAQSAQLMAMGPVDALMSKTARWYAEAEQFKVDRALALLQTPVPFDLTLGGRMWLHTDDGVIVRSRGEWSLASEQLALQAQLAFAHQGVEKDWRAEALISGLRVGGQALEDVSLQLQRDGGLSILRSENLSLQPVLAVLQQWLGEAMPDAWHGVSGRVRHLQLVYDHDLRRPVSATLAFEALQLDSEWLRFNGLAGELRLSHQDYDLLIDSTQGALSLPGLFRGSMRWNRLIAQMRTSLHNPDNTVQLNTLWCDCEGFMLNAEGLFSQHQGNQLNLVSHVRDVDIPVLQGFWPHRIWKPRTIQWLDEGLLSGQVSEGAVYYQGLLQKDAIESGLGQFQSFARVQEALVRYHPDWPSATIESALAQFIDMGMRVDVERGRVMGNRIRGATARIVDYDEPALELDIRAASRNNQLVSFLQHSPLAESLSEDLGFAIQGEQRLNLNMAVPLKDDEAAVEGLNGTGALQFKDAEFISDFIHLTDINGEIRIDHETLDIESLDARLYDQPMQVFGRINARSDARVRKDLHITGPMDIRHLLRDFDVDEWPLHGQSPWDIHILQDADGLRFAASTDLVGVDSDLPEPLRKAGDEARLLTLQSQIPWQNTPILVRYGDVFSAQLMQRDNGAQLQRVQLGEAADFTGPFGGRVRRLNLDRWLEMLASESTAPETQLDTNEAMQQPLNLAIDTVVFMSREFRDVNLQLSQGADGLDVQVMSPEIQGVVNVPVDLADKGILVDLDYLYWRDVDERYVENKDFNALSIPDIHLWVDAFHYADVPFGSMHMEVRKVVDGLKIEKLSLQTEWMEFNIVGLWQPDQHSGRSSFQIVMISENLARFLNNIGFDSPISEAQTIVAMDVSWDGLPSQFDLSRLNGRMNVSIGSGEVLDSKPGIGRVFGLLSLTNLPRRLILDFKDVFSSGLRFQSMNGEFSILNGRATTEDFTIKSSSAEIAIRGTTGLVQQDYDQTITVKPKIGQTLPTIGAIAGGAVGAAAGFLVQGIFRKQLSASSKIVYRVSGSWDEPLIELIENE